MPAVSDGIRAKGGTGKKFLIKHSRVKRNVTQKGVRVDKGMGGKKLLQGGDEQPCVMDGFVPIWGIGGD